MNNNPSFWQRFTRDIRIGLFASVLALGLTVVLSTDLLWVRTSPMQLGLPANEEVVAPFTKTYYSDYLTAEAQERAVNLVPDVYTSMDTNIGRAQTNRARAVFAFMDTVRADPVTDLVTKAQYLQSIDDLVIETAVAEALIGLPEEEYRAVRTNVLRSIEESMQEEIREPALAEARRAARQRISFDLNRTQEAVVSSLAPQFVVANAFFDDVATGERRAAAREGVEPQIVTITKDETIVSTGIVVDELHLEKLEEMNLLQPETSWWGVAALFMASTLFAILLSLYWVQFHIQMPNWTRHLFLLTVLIIIFAFAAKIMVASGPFLPYMMPMAALSMLLAVIFEPRLSLFVTVGIVGLVALATDSSLEIVAYLTVGGTLAVLVMNNVYQINGFFRAGLISAFGNVAVILVFHLQPDLLQPFSLVQLIGMGFLNGIFFSASLAIAGLFLAGTLFGIVTMLQLQELSRLDHPLLQELLRRAPGTYHHSIMVANLAEQAAERVKANSTLVRVGAFYHDIGKISRPPFYTENQEGINPHDTMDPYESARIIVGHVTDGLELARRYRLPMRIQEFIASHHGTRLVRAFHAKAVAQAGGDAKAVDVSLFQYPGPLPHTKETGIVLLADAIDAVSNALRPNTLEAIERLVNSIVDDDLKGGQLDFSGLTLADIKAIRASFIETLQGRFHVRIKYPGNEKLEDPPKDVDEDDEGVTEIGVTEAVVEAEGETAAVDFEEKPAIDDVAPEDVGLADEVDEGLSIEVDETVTEPDDAEPSVVMAVVESDEVLTALRESEFELVAAESDIDDDAISEMRQAVMEETEDADTMEVGVVSEKEVETEADDDSLRAKPKGKKGPIQAPIVTVGSPSGKAGALPPRAVEQMAATEATELVAETEVVADEEESVVVTEPDEADVEEEGDESVVVTEPDEADVEEAGDESVVVTESEEDV
ncbi:MAG TPA: HDIG domain-containing protein [Anaerolineae bacterium]|nr:HDIG domain-containing protein [Anaerolineae bacterium]